MSALINSVEHALAVAASDTVKVAKFVEKSASVKQTRNREFAAAFPDLGSTF